MVNNEPNSQLKLNSELRDQLAHKLGVLEKEKMALQRELREQKAQATAANEDLFLELLDVFDAIEFLLNYMRERSELPPQFIERLPKSLSIVEKKLLGVLHRRKVEPIELNGSEPDFQLCRVIEREERSDLDDQTITKVVRQGFCYEDKVLRPMEVITSKKESE
ncbi:nucleotide exchange factor GrpE [Spirulina sp. CS-785/01]|uniref:nucleotide exchange factor GrpE n=1 Tax=Spirulina sp. CS-785/01 TaxID=3021716 RepID=UPI00232BD5E1|nr:nucleotide exchange factor GrpE [Spirulina sp. CS-785/01]MDB9312023.1 nucleotide exchange factor GrpE [Spirulina sp. CS-785/01]